MKTGEGGIRRSLYCLHSREGDSAWFVGAKPGCPILERARADFG